MSATYDEKTNKPILMTFQPDGGEKENVTSLDQLPEGEIDKIVEALLIEGELKTDGGLYELVDGLYLNQVYGV